LDTARDLDQRILEGKMPKVRRSVAPTVEKRGASSRTTCPLTEIRVVELNWNHRGPTNDTEVSVTVLKGYPWDLPKRAAGIDPFIGVVERFRREGCKIVHVIVPLVDEIN